MNRMFDLVAEAHKSLGNKVISYIHLIKRSVRDIYIKDMCNYQVLLYTATIRIYDNQYVDITCETMLSYFCFLFINLN